MRRLTISIGQLSNVQMLMRKCMKNQILDAVLRLHIFNLTREHHLIRLAYLPQNINERIVVHFTGDVKPF